MADNTKNTKAKQRRSATMAEPRKTYLPGMGHDWLLPLYDPLQKLLGVASAHRPLVYQAEMRPSHRAISVQLDRGFAEELPYPDASFDRVFSAFMFHHLGPDGKEKTLHEARRVLKPGGSLHLLDFGGAKVRSDGFIARLQRRSGRLRDNFGDRIPTLMREAGFADPTEVAHRVTIVGRFTYYRAAVPRAESGAAQTAT